MVVTYESESGKKFNRSIEYKFSNQEEA